jgi:organic hydroperoxide reductase OsmC/OhrA
MAPDRSEHEYQVAAWWTSGRTGIAKSRSNPNAIHFTAPKSFGGLEGRWTPEELLLAAISGCFTTTFRTIVSKAESDFTDLEVEAVASMRKVNFGYMFTEIVLRPALKIADPQQRERAIDLLNRAARLCLVSRTLDTPLRVEPKVEVTYEFASSESV